MRFTGNCCPSGEGTYPGLLIWFAAVFAACLLVSTVGHSVFDSTNRGIRRNAQHPAVEGSSKVAQTDTSGPVLVTRAKPNTTEQQGVIGGGP